MTVKVTGSLKWKKRSHANTQGSQLFVTNVEVVMGEAAATLFYDAIVGIIGWVFRLDGSERIALLHAFQDEVDAKSVLPFEFF